MTKKDWTVDVRWRISYCLSQYYNFCLQKHRSLQHKHNIARQIFIQKEDGTH